MKEEKRRIVRGSPEWKRRVAEIKKEAAELVNDLAVLKIHRDHWSNLAHIFRGWRE